ncbi:hypothetical protein WISP_88025 [Willisornis vidua]|uniref:Uncharacterized protein n=1 Tax=Willisornis vidua TaxID=1566151 RepID=A0ABQ9D780_9PASS|nr:hypothetical protein WISP_88025 [Willisornis vidua]
MPSCPTAGCLAEETNTHLATTSFQVVAESDKVSPQPPLLQAEQPQLPQLLLIGLVLHTLHQPRCPSLDTLQNLNIIPRLRGPEHSIQGATSPVPSTGKNHFPGPASHTIPDKGEDPIGLLGQLGILLAHIQLPVSQNHQFPFHLAALQALCPQPVALQGVVMAKVQDPALGLVKPHAIG